MSDHQNHLDERAAAIQIIAELRKHSYTAYLAGGCVRDQLLGEVPKDYDVATDARPEQISAYFRKTASVGAAFGVVLVRDYGATIEVASFRSDGVYSDARRPDSIEYSTPEMDARRRDFTINALFLDPMAGGPDGEVIDFVDGRRDIEARVLRAVGDPEHRLQEDHLRALRAVRFAARYGLKIEQGTRNAIAKHALELRGVSIERVGEEMRRMLTHPNRVRACELIDELGLDDAIFGNLSAFHGDVMERLGDDASYPLVLASLALTRGHGIDEDPGAICGRFRERLDLSNQDRDGMRAVLDLTRAMHTRWDEMGVAAKRRLGGRQHACDALSLYHAWCQVRGIEHAQRVADELGHWAGLEDGLCPPPLLDGGDLITLGFEPGPRFREVLDAVYDAQLEGRVEDRKQALVLARELAGNSA